MTRLSEAEFAQLELESAQEARGGVVVAGMALLAAIAVAIFVMGLVTGWATA